ncbi:MAG: lysophospholipid acyltransferase family protein [Myxococcota bacterium]
MEEPAVAATIPRDGETAGASAGSIGSSDVSGRRRARIPRKLLSRTWQLTRAGLGFAYFGVGGWLACLVVLPLLRAYAWVLGLSREALSLRTQRLVHHGARSFIGCATTLLRPIGVRWVGEEALSRGPVLVVANHPSLIDTPLLASKMPQADFIVSPDWLRIGWLRRTIEAADYLHADRGADVVGEAAKRLRGGRSVVVYPEGSRSPPEGLRRFQRGAAHIALEAGCDLLPVTLRVTPRALMKGERWIDFPREKPVWHIEVGQPIHPDDHLDGSEPRSLAARRLTRILEADFQRRWDRGSS